MSEPRESLADVQKEVAHIRSFLETTLSEELARIPRVRLFRTWHTMIKELTACVGTLVKQVDRLAHSVDSICNVLKQNDKGNFG